MTVISQLPALTGVKVQNFGSSESTSTLTMLGSLDSQMMSSAATVTVTGATQIVAVSGVPEARVISSAMTSPP